MASVVMNCSSTRQTRVCLVWQLLVLLMVLLVLLMVLLVLMLVLVLLLLLLLLLMLLIVPLIALFTTINFVRIRLAWRVSRRCRCGGLR